MKTHNPLPHPHHLKPQSGTGDWRKAFSLHALDLSPDLARMAQTAKSDVQEDAHWILSLPTLRSLVESSRDQAQQLADNLYTGEAITSLDVIQRLGHIATPYPVGLWATIRFVVRFHMDVVRFQWSTGFQVHALAEQ